GHRIRHAVGRTDQARRAEGRTMIWPAAHTARTAPAPAHGGSDHGVAAAAALGGVGGSFALGSVALSRRFGAEEAKLGEMRRAASAPALIGGAAGAALAGAMFGLAPQSRRPEIVGKGLVGGEAGAVIGGIFGVGGGVMVARTMTTEPFAVRWLVRSIAGCTL